MRLLNVPHCIWSIAALWCGLHTGRLQAHYEAMQDAAGLQFCGASPRFCLFAREWAMRLIPAFCIIPAVQLRQEQLVKQV
jgi:hypothetical protein